MKIVVAGLIILMTGSSAICQSITINDRLNTTNGCIIKYDKAEHAIGSAGLYAFNRCLLGWTDDKAFASSILIGFLWEVKDSLFDDPRYGSWTGDGFSWLDLVADIIGVYVGQFIVKVAGMK